jgi:hypothetical protein
MPGHPQECREHAKRCLQTAAEATSPLAKARFQQLSDTWMRLATDLERAPVGAMGWSPSAKDRKRYVPAVVSTGVRELASTPRRISLMSKAREYRDRAKRCRRFAKESVSETVCEHWLELAEFWDRLASSEQVSEWIDPSPEPVARGKDE